MARAEARLYKQKTGHRNRQLVERTTIQEEGRKATVGWIRSLIKHYFPEFVISEALILLSRTPTGYSAMRSCVPTSPDYFAWMFLEIIPIKEEPPKPSMPARLPGADMNMPDF